MKKRQTEINKKLSSSVKEKISITLVLKTVPNISKKTSFVTHMHVYNYSDQTTEQCH